MKDPKRLVEDCGSELELMLLQEGRRSFMDETRRLKVLGALGVGTAVAASSKTGWALATTWKKVWVGGLAVCAGVGGSVYFAQNQSVSPPATDPVFAPKALELAPVEAQAPSLAVEPAAVAPVVAPAEQTSPSQPLDAAQQRGTVASKVERHAAAPRTSSLAQEVAAIDQARAAVRSGNGAQALGLVEDYLQEFPKGGLRLEAEVVRVQALAALGKRAEASARAKKLLSRNPNSVLAGRLRGYVVE
jgi:hypothetical protein